MHAPFLVRPVQRAALLHTTTTTATAGVSDTRAAATASSASDATSHGRSLCDGLHGSYSVAFHVAAVVIILVVSLVGTALPMLTQYVALLRDNPYVFAVGKTAATGVLLAVSCIHLINEASVALREPCVPAFFRGYEAYAFLIALSAALLMQMLDLQLALVAERWLRARHARGHGDGSGAHVTAAVPHAVDKGSVVLVTVDAASAASSDNNNKSTSAQQQQQHTNDASTQHRLPHTSSDSDNNNTCHRRSSSHCRDDGHDKNVAATTSTAVLSTSTTRTSAPTRYRSEDVRVTHDDDDDDTAAVTARCDAVVSTAAVDVIAAHDKSNNNNSEHSNSSSSRHHHHHGDGGSGVVDVHNLHHHHDGSGGTHHDACAGHSHGIVVPPADMGAVRRVIAAVCMECGVTLHSLFVGLAVGLTTDAELTPLLVALVFHQLFEGMAMGARLVDARFAAVLEWSLAVLFAVSAPLGIAVGITAAVVSPQTMSGGLFVSLLAMLDAFCGGILLYLAFTLLLADFVSDVRAYGAEGGGEGGGGGVRWRRCKMCGLYAALWTGMLLMAAVGKWL